jgi:hypothetical protein
LPRYGLKLNTKMRPHIMVNSTPKTASTANDCNPWRALTKVFRAM